MKTKYFLIFIVLLISCKDDIYNERYRNENYVFYQENGKNGKWLKIDPKKEIKPPKSFSTYFFPNGNRYAELEVIDSFPNRIIKYYNKNDKLTKTTIFKSDTLFKVEYLDGLYEKYHSNIGHLSAKGIIKNNLSQGKWIFYRDDGKSIRQIVDYKDDIPHGIREDYWPNGNIKVRINYVNGEQMGKAIHYYETGEVEEINFLRKGVLYGLMKSFYKSGKPKYVRKYWNNKIVDTSYTYYEDGNLKNFSVTKLDTISGSTFGKELRYYENGEIHMESGIKNDLPHGILIKYYRNGNRKSWQEVNENKINGKFITYYENGKKKKVGKAKNNVLKDTVYHYKKDGSPLKTYIIQNGFIKDSIIY